VNIRKSIYFFLLKEFRGINAGDLYDQYWQEDQNGISPDTTKNLLIKLLKHCQEHVPYYARIMDELGGDFRDDPIRYLERFPILTKEIIRENFSTLQSSDIQNRKWFYMTSGGSTGEPGRVIQDYDFSAKSCAINLLFSRFAGRETGECEVYLWGSEREILKGRETWKARFINKLTNSIFINAFRMSPQRMVEAVKILNTQNPKLIIAYADSIIGLAKFIEKEKIYIKPQKAIITSAETLYPFMREKIESVFQCRVYNRYGSREIGSIACERPGIDGLWIAPWGNYLEILNDQGNRVPDGTEGEIIITSLSNYAMPLIRYRIDDIGALTPQNQYSKHKSDQILQKLTGRVINLFITNNGELVNAGYLCGLLFYKDWVKKNQIIQKDYSHILFRIVQGDGTPQKSELEEITKKTRKVFGDKCKVEFEFVDDIVESSSGKLHYVISEIKK
jgi:phenylacetate-CoA ligase